MKHSGVLSCHERGGSVAVCAIALLLAMVTGCSFEDPPSTPESDAIGRPVRSTDVVQKEQFATAATLAFALDLGGRRLQLDLRPTARPSVAPRQTLQWGPGGTLREVSREVPDCFYDGVVSDRDTGLPLTGSYVSVTTCLHTAGHGSDETVHGVFSTGQELFTISPESAPDTSMAGVVHGLYPAESVRLGGASTQYQAVRLTSARPPSVLPQGIWEGTPKETKLVELVLINDAARVAALGGLALADGLALMENVNAVFASSGITPRVRVVVAGQVDLVTDPFAWPPFGGGEVVASESLALLDAWAASAALPHHDARLMLTRQDLEQSTVGIAYVGAMCGPTATLLVQTTQNLAMIGATIATHELGHSMGMQHDGVDNTCAPNGFIMASAAGPNNPASPQFSSCSHEEFSKFLSAKGPSECLTDVPQEVIATDCGDGALGPGEACDCGQTDCSQLDPCCDGATCQLVSGAECSSFNDPSACCVDCHMAKREDEVVCRAARDECDAPEVCPGGTLHCPGDAFPAGGVTCTDRVGGAGRCFAGSCVSRGVQCSDLGALFGEDFGPPSPGCAANTACDMALCDYAGTCASIDIASAPEGAACGTGQVCQGGACIDPADVDECPSDPSKTTAVRCGCGEPDDDSDADTVPDCLDECPLDERKEAAGLCGCGLLEVDGQGVTICGDDCPSDPAKTAPGLCGCGSPDVDRDTDGAPDCLDQCPDNPQKVQPDAEGCLAPATSSGGAGMGAQPGSGGAGTGGGTGSEGSLTSGGASGSGLSQGAGGSGATGPGASTSAAEGGGCSSVPVAPKLPIKLCIFLACLGWGRRLWRRPRLC